MTYISAVAIRNGETPVPIPNTTVKTDTAESTLLETAREDRWLPHQKGKYTKRCFTYISKTCTLKTEYRKIQESKLKYKYRVKTSRTKKCNSKQKGALADESRTACERRCVRTRRKRKHTPCAQVIDHRSMTGGSVPCPSRSLAPQHFM